MRRRVKTARAEAPGLAGGGDRRGGRSDGSATARRSAGELSSPVATATNRSAGQPSSQLGWLALESSGGGRPGAMRAVSREFSLFCVRRARWQPARGGTHQSQSGRFCYHASSGSPASTGTISTHWSCEGRHLRARCCKSHTQVGSPRAVAVIFLGNRVHTAPRPCARGNACGPRRDPKTVPGRRRRR